jgi:hypothetical protein
METLERLKKWLNDPANTTTQSRLPGVFDGELIRRKKFVTTNGITLSIQMSAAHNCVVDESVEMWNCPPSPLLMAFGDGQDPYGYVPLDVVAGYINSLESLGDNHDYN